MHDNLGYLFAAFAISWIAIGGYLVYLGQQVRALRDEAQAVAETTTNESSDGAYG